MRISKATTEKQLQQIEELYLRAFPEAERKPFSLMVQKQEEGLTEILYVEEEGEFCGLAIMIAHKDLVLLDYFAIDDAKRNGGIGSRVLSELMERYKQQRLVIEIERVEECENKEERIRRQRFYHRNGMVDLGITICLYGVVMVLLSNGKPVTYEEYISIYTQSYGNKILENISMLEVE